MLKSALPSKLGFVFDRVVAVGYCEFGSHNSVRPRCSQRRVSPCEMGSPSRLPGFWIGLCPWRPILRSSFRVSSSSGSVFGWPSCVSARIANEAARLSGMDCFAVTQSTAVSALFEDADFSAQIVSLSQDVGVQSPFCSNRSYAHSLSVRPRFSSWLSRSSPAVRSAPLGNWLSEHFH